MTMLQQHLIELERAQQGIRKQYEDEISQLRMQLEQVSSVPGGHIRKRSGGYAPAPPPMMDHAAYPPPLQLAAPPTQGIATQPTSGPSSAANMPHLADIDPDTVPTSMKIEGHGWFALFSPKVVRSLKIELIHTFDHDSVVCCVAFSPDGRYFAAGCNRTTHIYDILAGSPIAPDGKYLATGAEDKQIRIWDIAKKSVRRVMEGHEQDIYSLEFSSDGHILVSGSGDHTMMIWDWTTGQCLHKLQIRKEDEKEPGVTSVAVSPNGRFVAAGSLDKVVRIWDVATGRLLERLEGHEDSVYSVAFMPDGKSLVSGSLDKTLRMWRLGGGNACTRDFGICTPLLKAQLGSSVEYHRPIFGICLGHQGIAHLMGGKVTYAPRIMHGRMSQIHRQDTRTVYEDVLGRCDSPFWAVRYHSLVVDKASLPDDLVLTAVCYENDVDVEALKNASYMDDDNKTENDRRNHILPHASAPTNGLATVMGFQHRTLPLWGVQFHPESVSTEHGAQMINNFTTQSWAWMQKYHRPTMSLDPAMLTHSVAVPKIPRQMRSSEHSSFELYTKTCCPIWVEPEQLVNELVASGVSLKSISWLDSSRKSSPYSKMSVLSIEPALTLTYSTLHRELTTQDRQGQRTETLQTSFFSYMSSLLGQFGRVNTRCLDDNSPITAFRGGFIGYFGYEMKRESMDGYVVPPEQKCMCVDHSQPGCCGCKEEPDAAFHFIDQFWVFDHAARRIQACSLVRTSSDSGSLPGVGLELKAAQAWMARAEQLVLRTADNVRRKKMADEYISLTPASSVCSTPAPEADEIKGSDLFTANVQRDAYLESIKQSVQQIKEGESYEICLTTRFRCDIPGAQDDLPWQLYSRYLRKNNPAPFSALLTFGHLSLLSSSPERFMKITADGVAEMKPIKGTMARAFACTCEVDCDGGEECVSRQEEDEKRKQQLWQDVKERAENLMIVDLIRNDLAQVCEPSSVKVPKLIHVETYEKVHHLVSTIQGTLKPYVDRVEAVRRCFPPGSMTGAPKLRSVQLLDQLERHKPRGVYSGCLGYFSLDGATDFNVVIRTAIIATQQDKVKVSVGGGGAITFLSDPEQEWKETLLKTKSVAPSVREYLEDY
ncbi:Protein phosphatase PP2A regulatory subunit B [Apophysomyces sp. BC1034]|nr:Protein phosphatase PP2A regulatory subunit B [Apophysomyces sp. BC1034]